MQTGGRISVNEWEEFKLDRNFFQLHSWDAFVSSWVVKVFFVGKNAR